MAINWSQWLQIVSTILQVEDNYGAPFFNAMAPYISERASLIMQRDPDLDFLATRIVDESQTTTGGSRAVPIAPTLIVVEGVSLIIPANAAPNEGTRVPCYRASREFCDFIWPQESLTKAPNTFEPVYYAIPSMFEVAGSGATADEPQALPSSMIIAPTPDGQYKVEQHGTMRLPPLSESNQTTFLSTFLPDMLIAASVVAGALIQRDMGATGAKDDPSLATHWQEEYDRLKRGAAVESARQKAQSTDWTAYAPAPLANVPRTEAPPPPPPLAPPGPPWPVPPRG